MNQQQSGLYEKFVVSRVDGRDLPGGDRADARYFVLDTVHDKFALTALAAYADACRCAYPNLSAQLFSEYKLMPNRSLESASEIKATVPLAKDHTGMRVDYSGLLPQTIRIIKRSEPIKAELLRQFETHLTELGQRFYAGDIAVVDEFLQLYCIEQEARERIIKEGVAV